jgi:mono/diheme cytochrome c family protein
VINRIGRNAARATAAWLGLAAIVGCAPPEDWPPQYPASTYTQSQLGSGDATPFTPHPEVGAKLSAALLEQFGTPEAPKLKGADEERNRSILKGSRLFRTQCMYCHGLGGAGNGPSAQLYNPLPRDYRRGMFKWKSTPTAQRPTREDLLRTISEGVTGTSMPPFKRLPQEDLKHLVEYVTFLSQRGEVEFGLMRAAIEAPDKPEEMKDFLEEFGERIQQVSATVRKAWTSAKPDAIPGGKIEEAKDAAAWEASVRNGRSLYLGNVAGCVKCHGVDGTGQRQQIAGLTDDEMRDVWGNYVLPRNLREGVYRGGGDAIDLYRRVHDGIPASKMPSNDRTLKPNETWDLVNFLRALPYRPELLQPATAARTGDAPASGASLGGS